MIPTPSIALAKFGSSSMARRKKGRAAAGPFSYSAFSPRLSAHVYNVKIANIFVFDAKSSKNGLTPTLHFATARARAASGFVAARISNRPPYPQYPRHCAGMV
jgi:hypothetical protein